MAVHSDRFCKRCSKKVRMVRCEVCKGQGGSLFSQCNSGCSRKGWLCPTHGKNY